MPTDNAANGDEMARPETYSSGGDPLATHAEDAQAGVEAGSSGPAISSAATKRRSWIARRRDERHATKAYRWRPRLMVTVREIGNASVVLGTREPLAVKAEIVTGIAPEWIDAMQAGGRLTIRTSDITAAWVDE